MVRMTAVGTEILFSQIQAVGTGELASRRFRLLRAPDEDERCGAKGSVCEARSERGSASAGRALGGFGWSGP